MRLCIRIMANVIAFLFAWKAVTQIAASDLPLAAAFLEQENTFVLVFLASCMAFLLAEPRT